VTAAATVAQAVLFQPEQAWGQRRAADKQRKACQMAVGRHRDRPALTRMGYSRRPRPWRTDKCYHGSIVHVAFGTIRPPNGLSFPQAGAVSLRTNEGETAEVEVGRQPVWWFRGSLHRCRRSGSRRRDCELRIRDTRGLSVPIESEPALILCFDAFSSREPVSTSLENAL
jgi:hypothetical protein